MILACCCAFFAPWGPAIVLPGTTIGASKLFVGSALLLITYWLFVVRHKSRAFPPAFNWLILFILFHSLVVYGLLYPTEFQFNLASTSSIDESVIALEEGRGAMVIRFFFNVLFAYAFSSIVRSKRELKSASTWLCLGFASMLFVGHRGAISYSEGFYRQTGGFLNPNDFGAAAVVAVLAGAFVLQTPRRGLASGALALVGLLAGVYGVLASASRSSAGALAIGVLVLFYYSKPSRKLCYLALGFLVCAAVIPLANDQVYTAVEVRFSSDTIRNTRGSMRVDIFRDYLEQFPRYALTGVGLKRAIEVTKYAHSTHTPHIPHSTYIQYLVELGGVGLFLFVLSLSQFFRGLHSPLRDSKRVDERDATILGLFLAWTTIFCLSSVDSRMFWLSWAMVAAHRTCVFAAEAPKTPSPSAVPPRSTAT